MSRTNSALTLSNSRIKPKTYRLCVRNLVPKKATLRHSRAPRILSAEVVTAQDTQQKLGVAFSCL